MTDQRLMISSANPKPSVKPISICGNRQLERNNEALEQAVPRLRKTDAKSKV